MAEEGEEGPTYVFITENGETKTTSRGYTGKAVAQYPNQDNYEGDFVDGIREGRGIYRYASSGEKYEGEWIKNFKHGIGKMTYAKAGEYNGFWENGKRHGEGVFTYTNGDTYSGWWKFGEKEGTGCYHFKETGMKLYGDWTAGSITKGKWIYPNGMYFEGSFENNKPKGTGKWVFKNGNELEGEYEQKPKEVDDDEVVEDEEENAVKKPKFELIWHSSTNIAESASKVNGVDQ